MTAAVTPPPDMPSWIRHGKFYRLSLKIGQVRRLINVVTKEHSSIRKTVQQSRKPQGPFCSQEDSSLIVCPSPKPSSRPCSCPASSAGVTN